MSLNLKPILTSATTSEVTTHRSDTLKAELAKYRQLKSQGTFQTQLELRANTPYFQNEFSAIPSPAGDDASQSTLLALLRFNSSEAGSNVSKNEYRSSFLYEESPQLTPIEADSPLLTDLNKLEGTKIKREPLAPNNRPKFSSESGSRNSMDFKTPMMNRNPASKVQPAGTVIAQTKKKNIVSRSIAVEGKQAFNGKENMGDLELQEERLLAEVYKKNVQSASKTKPSNNLMRKENARYQTDPGSIEKKRVNTERIDRSLREKKNISFSEEKNSSFTGMSASKPHPSKRMSERKKTMGNVSREIDASALKENVERKTAAPNIETSATFRPLNSANRDKESRLEDEVNRWRAFGKTMSESYDSLNTKYKEYMKEKETDKKIISALKEQVSTLKALLQNSHEDVSKSTTLSSSRTEDGRDVIIMAREMEKIKTELRETAKTMDFLKDENDVLRRTLEEERRKNEKINYYQELAETRFKECSALAEEIICLRTDLDRSHSNYLRVQRESSARKEHRDSLCSGTKIKQFRERDSFQAKSRTFSSSKIKSFDDQFDDIPPSPHDYTTLPFKLEKLNTQEH